MPQKRLVVHEKDTGSNSGKSNNKKKSIELIAKEVIAGKWGNGDDQEEQTEKGRI